MPPDSESEARWIADAALDCRCYPECCDHPCAGCLQDGICDQMPCTCDERWDYDWEDDDAE